jgi:hypothetical protein
MFAGSSFLPLLRTGPQHPRTAIKRCLAVKRVSLSHFRACLAHDYLRSLHTGREAIVFRADARHPLAVQ